MVRSRWVKAVMATVVSTGLAWGQSGVPSPTPAAGDPTGRVITVNEAGKAPQKCLVVKASVDSQGRKVLQVQSLANGEVMTIITEGAPVLGEAPTGKPRTLRTQIFHWGRDHTPPAAVCDNGCSSCQQLPVITSVPAKSVPVCTTCAPADQCGCGPVVTNCEPCKPGTGSTTIIADPWAHPNKTTTTTVVSVAPPPKPIETKVVQAAPTPSDKYRESWGKPDKPKMPAAEVVQVQEPVRLPPPELPHADKKKPDPLLSDPTQYVKKPLEEKLPTKGEALPTDPPKLPPGESLGAGSRSITDSGSVESAPNPVAELPLMNMGPPPRPVWNVPRAPQPINPGRNTGVEANQGGIGYNAFTPVELTPPAPGSAAQSALGNAFSSDLDPRPVAGVFGPAGAHPMPPAGYGPMNARLPSTPYGPVVRMPAPQGTTSPTDQGTKLAMLPRNNGVTQVGYQTSAAPVAAGMNSQQLTGMLRDALYPSQREWAAEKLSSLNWKENDTAVQALAVAVGNDPCPTVRAACVHALAQMKADSYAVVSAVQSAKKDADARVRAEAAEALSVLAPGAAAPAPLSPAVHPTAVVPPPAPLPPLSK